MPPWTIRIIFQPTCLWSVRSCRLSNCLNILTFDVIKQIEGIFPVQPLGLTFRETTVYFGDLVTWPRSPLVGWLLGFNCPSRQYFSLYRAVSQREGERGERIDKSKNVQITPTRTYCKRIRPLPYFYQNCRTPRHWKFTQHHCTTRRPFCKQMLFFF